MNPDPFLQFLCDGNHFFTGTSFSASVLLLAT